MDSRRSMKLWKNTSKNSEFVAELTNWNEQVTFWKVFLQTESYG